MADVPRGRFPSFRSHRRLYGRQSTDARSGQHPLARSREERQGTPWHAGMLQGVERFMTSWYSTRMERVPAKYVRLKGLQGNQRYSHNGSEEGGNGQEHERRKVKSEDTSVVKEGRTEMADRVARLYQTEDAAVAGIPTTPSCISYSC